MPDSPKLINWFIFLLITLIWGSSFILMKAGMTTLSPYQVAAIRMLSGATVLFPVVLKEYRSLPRQKIKLIFLSGLLGSFFPAFLFCLAETRIDSSLAGILNALTPLFTICIGALFFQLTITTQKVMGVIIGLIGLCILFISNGKINLQYFGYASLVLIATLCYAINVNMVGRHLKGVGSVTIASFAFAFLIPPSLLILIFTGYFNLPLADKSILLSTAAACILGVFGTAIASILFYMLIKKAGPTFSTMVTYGIPFVAIGWGLMYGESITLIQVICLVIILSGLFIANLTSKNLVRIKKK